MMKQTRCYRCDKPIEAEWLPEGGVIICDECLSYTDSLSVEKLQEQLNTAKKALTEIAYTRQEIWRGGTLVGFEATEDAKIAYDALAAIGWDGCPVGLIVKNGLTKEELEGSDDE
ncbi:hypothetical protein ABQ274_10385 [Lactococcus lactis]|uniref:hypothetical protein n=1 Tax=Lactococcus lactis TaxID=1358 RepID=UPI00338DA6FC